MRLEEYKQKIINIIDNNSRYIEKLQAICDFLKQHIGYYDWVGFYFKNGTKQELKLARFAGENTEHTIIPFGKGICGQVAINNKKLVVQDVSKEDNYISCGWKVKSEIVIPIFVNNENIGQIDVDSHTIKPFTEKDTALLEFVCQEVAKFNILPV
jgi:L-methionine (R)-S-oxide reductase